MDTIIFYIVSPIIIPYQYVFSFCTLVRIESNLCKTEMHWEPVFDIGTMGHGQNLYLIRIWMDGWMDGLLERKIVNKSDVWMKYTASNPATTKNVIEQGLLLCLITWNCIHSLAGIKQVKPYLIWISGYFVNNLFSHSDCSLLHIAAQIIYNLLFLQVWKVLYLQWGLIAKKWIQSHG